MLTLCRESPWSSLEGILRLLMLKGNAKAGVIARQFLSIRPQADLVQQALGADSP